MAADCAEGANICGNAANERQRVEDNAFHHRTRIERFERVLKATGSTSFEVDRLVLKTMATDCVEGANIWR
jgi:hypothetical protein